MDEAGWLANFDTNPEAAAFAGATNDRDIRLAPIKELIRYDHRQTPEPQRTVLKPRVNQWVFWIKRKGEQ